MNGIFYDSINTVFNETMITAIKNAMIGTSFIVVVFIMYNWYQEIKKEPDNSSFAEKAINTIDIVTNRYMGKRLYLITFITYGILLFLTCLLNMVINNWKGDENICRKRTKADYILRWEKR